MNNADFSSLPDATNQPQALTLSLPEEVENVPPNGSQLADSPASHSVSLIQPHLDLVLSHSAAQEANCIEICRTSVVTSGEASLLLAHVENELFPQLSKQLHHLNKQTAQVERIQSKMTDVYTRLRTMRMKLVAAGIVVPSEPDPLEEIERRDQEEIRRKAQESRQRRLLRKAMEAEQQEQELEQEKKQDVQPEESIGGNHDDQEHHIQQDPDNNQDS